MTTSRGTSPRDRIVLAFAGDLESSIAVPWLAETEDAEIVAVTLDFGQSRDLEGIRDRALTLGAVRAHVLDVRAEFARDYLLPGLKAGALDDRGRRLAAAQEFLAVQRFAIDELQNDRLPARFHRCSRTSGFSQPEPSGERRAG